VVAVGSWPPTWHPASVEPGAMPAGGSSSIGGTTPPWAVMKSSMNVA
jgi:hypothetical protein